MNHLDVKYVFYPTLLDVFQSYLDSDVIWNKYWGRSLVPKITLNEFKENQKQKVLDTINKVKREPNILADRGTVFNEIVDCLREKGDPEKIKFHIDNKFAYGKTNDFSFQFFLSDCNTVAEFYKSALPQVKCESYIDTNYGKVRLFGYIDELTFSKIYDIKTTQKYNMGKFCQNWQHKIYPFCLKNEGLDLKEFVYDIVVMDDNNKIISRHFETYIIKDEEQLIRQYCERFINFIEENKELISNRNIFGERKKLYDLSLT